jgi:hypothetical protein
MITGLYNTQNKSGEKEQIIHTKGEGSVFLALALASTSSMIRIRFDHLGKGSSSPSHVRRKPTEYSKQTKIPPSKHLIQGME